MSFLPKSMIVPVRDAPVALEMADRRESRVKAAVKEA
jgi:hypothetical protein